MWAGMETVSLARSERRRRRLATDRMDKNAEGYADPTAGGAWNNIREKERRKEAARMTVINNLIPILKQTAELAGFEVVGRITLRDKASGKEYR